MQFTTLLLLVTSCLSILVAEETQSANPASSKPGASLVLPSNQQQQHQQQQYQRQLQQHLVTRLAHSVTNQQPSEDKTGNNALHTQFASSSKPSDHWLDFDRPSNGISVNVNGDSYTGADKGFQTDKSEYKLQNFKNVNWPSLQLSRDQQLLQNKYNVEYTSLIPQAGGDGRSTQHDNHRVDKREADASFPTSYEEIQPENMDEYYPIFLDRRYQVLLPSNAQFSSPYLSAQEFKKTFRRSDPYFMGKRTDDLFSDEDMQFSEDLSASPTSPGRRDPPYFDSTNELPLSLDNDVEKFETGDDNSLLGDNKEASTFFDKRVAPYFVGKRRPPLFIGKRVPVFEFEDAAFSSPNDKKAAPKFVGRRGAPYFVGKRMSSDSTDKFDWVLKNKKGAPKFVGRRGAPYFVGKRGAPKFVGKRVGSFEIDDEEGSLVDDMSRAASLLSIRSSPYFVGKRGAPKFIGKRWANPALQYHELAVAEDKRQAPKFVGRRASPYFVGKRLNVDQDQPVAEDEKRRAPAFVGKRRAPYFVGKRRAPLFVGKRLADLEWLNPKMSFLEEKRAAPKFVRSRGPPIFVGKRAAPKFVRSRGPPLFVGKRAAPKFVRSRGPPLFVGKRAAPKFVRSRGPPLFVGKRAAPKFVRSRGPSIFVGKRAAPMFVGKRVLDLLNDSAGKVIVDQEADDDGQETNTYTDSIFVGQSTGESNSLPSADSTEIASHLQDSENINRLQTIENLKERIQEKKVHEATGTENRSHEPFQNDIVQGTEQLR